MKTMSDEPLVAIVLKALAILAVVGAVASYAVVYLDDAPRDAEGPAALAAGLRVAAVLGRAYTLTGSAICLWWMGEIVALLARIAANGDPGSAAKPTRRELEALLGDRKRAEKPANSEAENEVVPSYKLD